LLAPTVFLTPRHAPRRQHLSFSYANRFRGNVFTELFPSSGRLFSFIKNLLHSNGCRSVGGGMFLWNVDCLSTDQIMLHSRRQNFA
jgi:hypothetical protein